MTSAEDRLPLRRIAFEYPADLNPLWKAAQEHDLAIIHHSGSSGYPGYRDL